MEGNGDFRMQRAQYAEDWWEKYKS